MRVLFVTSEIHPLMKTGGLADVSASLPRALQSLGHQVTLLMPAYRDALAAAIPLGVKDGRHAHDRRASRAPAADAAARTPQPVWLLDCPPCSTVPATRTTSADGLDYPTTPSGSHAAVSRAALLAEDRIGLGWRPDVVHCNDWQSALVPLLLHSARPRPALVFTIHNLAYQGLFPAPRCNAPRLPTGHTGTPMRWNSTAC
jgi:starch synthase